MSNHLPVIAAIPNYNMAKGLEVLLPEVINQGYDDIYVLDDNSTDNSREAAEKYKPKVRFVAGDKNIGAGGNRNRVLSVLDQPCIIHFIDADMRLVSENIPNALRDFFSKKPDAGLAGGKILQKDGSVFLENFGPKITRNSHKTNGIRKKIKQLLKIDKKMAKELLASNPEVYKGRPNPFSEAPMQQVYWVAEGNMAIKSEIFASLGGFDSSLRYHEIQDLVMRMEKLELKRYYSPDFCTIHTELVVRSTPRHISAHYALAKIARKHGIRELLD